MSHFQRRHRGFCNDDISFWWRSFSVLAQLTSCPQWHSSAAAWVIHATSEKSRCQQGCCRLRPLSRKHENLRHFAISPLSASSGPPNGIHNHSPGTQPRVSVPKATFLFCQAEGNFEKGLLCAICVVSISLSEARDCITMDTKYNFHHSDWTQQGENKISHVQRDWWESGQPSSEIHLSDQG